MSKFYKKSTKGRFSKDEANLIKAINTLIEKDKSGIAQGIVDKRGLITSPDELKKMQSEIREAIKARNRGAISVTKPTPEPISTPPVDAAAVEPTPEPPINEPPVVVQKAVKKRNSYLESKDGDSLVKKLTKELETESKSSNVSIVDPLDDEPNIRDYAIDTPAAPSQPVANDLGDDIPAAGQDTIPENVIPEAKFVPPTNAISEEDIHAFEPPPPEPDIPKSSGGGASSPSSSPPPRADYQDLNTSQKRKAAKQTAEMLLGVYCQYIPEVYKFFVKIPFKKLDKIISAGEIDLKTQITHQGRDMTVQEYFNDLRGSIETLFDVDEETKTAILEPLIEVLMEKELALTPMQRLMFAIAQDQVNKMATAIQLTVMVNSGVAQMITLEKEKIESINKQTEAMNKQSEAMDRQTDAKRRAKKSEEEEEKQKEEEEEEVMSGSSAAEMAEEIIEAEDIEPIE